MKPARLRPALLAVAVLLAAGPAWAAVPLKELTQEKVRDWVASALQAVRKDPTLFDAWKRLNRQVVLDSEQVVYEHDKGKPTQLLWDVAPRRPLSPDERRRADGDLKKLFDFVLFEHNKGIVPGDQVGELKAVRKVSIKPNPAQRKRPDKAPPMTIAKDLTEDTVRDWMLVAADESRKDPAWADTWKELDALVEIDPGAIVYEHDKGVPTQLHWEVTPRRPLTPDERLLVEKDLKKLSDHMLFEHNKGLVPATDIESVKKVLDVEVGPNPEAPVATNPPPDNPTDIEKIKKAQAEVIDKIKKANAEEIDKIKKAQADEIDKVKKAQADEIDKLKKQHDADAAEIEKLKKNMPEQPADIEKIKKAQAEEIDKINKTHADEIDKIKKAQMDTLVEIDKLKKERADILADIEKCKKERADMAAVIENLKKETIDAQSEIERLKKVHEDSQIEIERLRKQSGGSTGGPSGGSTGGGMTERRPSGGYIMVVQPSSMIYYDCCSHCWVPGPASVVYYPAGSGAARRSELPRPPAFVAPTPTPAAGLPPPEQPKQTSPLEQPQANSVDAIRTFWIGYRSYWQGDYDRALASFDAAVRVNDQDARFWYYKALAERALGEMDNAEASAKRGRELHAALKPKADLVGAALERVQGQERRFLNAPEVVSAAAKE
ncbi:MAG TPA: hypothetical protein VMS17_16865 [Gemmataceae bacterium]|nr:hypothetical protein [Gemmataceae bacterium]